MHFDHSVFDGAVYLTHVNFGRIAHFMALKATRFFLYEVTFRRVPNFSTAHFEEAPFFDNVDFPVDDSDSELDDATKSAYPSFWKALRRIAIQGHDHERELQFFKGEIVARRGIRDKWYHLSYWAGLLYQYFSDFGISMARPVIWWNVSVLVFAVIYGCQSEPIVQQPITTPVKCIVGDGDARIAVIRLSIYNAIPFARVRTSRQIEHIYTCLFDIKLETHRIPETHSAVPSDIPLGVEVTGIVQIVISTIFIFLLVLSVRNHFRLK